ncbi:MAG TPA: hypothetical protein PLU30_22820 [Verrucomicrobiae bacterium]|nr:hypothetical protein [Verrucomicrobiae bacterium]
MSDSAKFPPIPDPFRFMGRCLRIPSGLPRRHRIRDSLGHGSFSCPVLLPPEWDCPIICVSARVPLVLIGLAGTVLIGSGDRHRTLGPGEAVGLLPGDFTWESVHEPHLPRGHVPLVVVAVATARALERAFRDGLLWEMYLNKAFPSYRLPELEPVGNILPLPSFETQMPPLDHVPLHRLNRAMVDFMGGPLHHRDYYRFLALGACRHLVGQRSPEPPERFRLRPEPTEAEKAEINYYIQRDAAMAARRDPTRPTGIAPTGELGPVPTDAKNL